ncbi:MAG: DUF2017 domain-containing protein [Streptosporangiaceae bacterium]
MTDYEPNGYSPYDDDHGNDVAAAFRAVPGGAAAYFEQAQAGVIRSLVSQIAELVAADSDLEPDDPGAGLDLDMSGSGPVDDLEAQLGLSSHARPPDDPVLARLLPDGYADDPDASAEFRRYTEESLRSAKVASAQAVLASLPPNGGEVRLSEPECQQWLRALNDVRLALSIRLGITDENDDLSEQLAVDDPRSAYIWVYQWLAYLQDSLLEALT